MPIIVDGVTIQDCGGVSTDAVNTEIVNADVNVVYAESCYAPGEIDFPEGGNFIVPPGVTSVNICMIGGGGGGAAPEDISSTTYGGGGFAGTVVSQAVATTPGESIVVAVGDGGAGQPAIGYGSPGIASSFGAVVASGGAGGNDINGDYAGNGGTTTNCRGTFTHGTSATGGGSIFYGGQAGFGDGGDALGGAGGIGAGGGAAYQHNGAGAGGNGLVKISWS